MNLTKFLSVLSFGIVFGGSAFAGQMTLTIGDEAYLSDCGGKVSVTKSDQGNGEQLNLVFSGVEKCSNFDILSANGMSANYDDKKIPGNNGDRGGSFTLPKRVIDLGYNNIKVVVRSNTGKTSDTIRLRFREVVRTPAPAPTPSRETHRSMSLMLGDEASLTACGGYVEIKKSAQGNDGEQVNLIFRGVQDCSNFDILSNDGQPINYPNKKLEERRDGTRGGSFTLPKSVIDYGWNNVKIVLKSNTGKHSDTIRVQFVAVPSPSMPIPQPPVRSSSPWL